ncbi:PD40 domain-containing protein [bacterium]|nr:PD40 domain-containing protein [bacterium]RIK72478.1 MAG: hypothetical protein DCC62_19520 [candidate division KSB1 bacterium]
MRKKYLLLLLLLGCGKNPFAPQSLSGPIYFSVTVGDYSQIHSIDVDGNGLIQLTTSAISKHRPRWSRDGGRILFTGLSRRTNIHFLPVIISDEIGRNERTVLEHGIRPVFSPGGDRIAFSYESQLPGFGGDYDIFIYDLSKEIATPILPDPDSSDTVADWSPDGRYLLVHESGTFFDPTLVYLFDLVDHTKTRYTDSGISMSGRFSPDGQMIAFLHRERNELEETIYVQDIYNNREKTKVVKLDSTKLVSLAWSPDGSQIVFSGSKVTPTEFKDGVVYSINRDGSKLRQIYTNPTLSQALDWRW